MRNHAITERGPAIIPSTGELFVRVPIGPLAVLVRRTADLVMNVLMLLGAVLCIPFAILAVGIPIALLVQLLLWFVRHL